MQGLENDEAGSISYSRTLAVGFEKTSRAYADALENLGWETVYGSRKFEAAHR